MGWRDHIKVHPAADLFPMMSESELKELADDIRKNGVRSRVALFCDEEGEQFLLDGRNRLEAIDRFTRFKIFDGDGELRDFIGWDYYGGSGIKLDDPYAFVVSANIYRRHLTGEQKQQLIGKLLKATPEKSNRQIAELTKADHKTVGAVRTKMESTGEIPQLESTVGKDGKARKQPVRAPEPKVIGLGDDLPPITLLPPEEERDREAEAATIQPAEPAPPADLDHLWKTLESALMALPVKDRMNSLESISRLVWDMHKKAKEEHRRALPRVPKELQEYAGRIGFRVQKDRDVYKAIHIKTGEMGFGSGSLEGMWKILNQVESGEPWAFRTPCGMPTNDEAKFADALMAAGYSAEWDKNNKGWLVNGAGTGRPFFTKAEDGLKWLEEVSA
jgi:hypothetical protein